MRRLSLIAIALLPAAAAAQQFTQNARIAHLSAPIALDTTGRFESAIDRVGDDMFIGGQPTERALREMKAQGVTTVVNLRTPEEMKRTVKFDEPALVAQLGMKYVYLPVRGDSAFPFTSETVSRFADAVEHAHGKVLLHCTVGWRASHLWAAYLIRDRGIAETDAIANARAINLMDEHHMTSNGKQPVEEFLGRTLTAVKHPE